MANLFASIADRVELFYLEKPGVEPQSLGEKCSDAYLQHDTFEERVADALFFIGHERTLKGLPDRSLTLLGLSE